MTCVRPRCRLLAVLFLVVAGVLVLVDEYRIGRYDAGTHALLAVHAAVYGSCLVRLTGLVLITREGFGWLLFAGLASSGVLMGMYRSLRAWEAIHMVLTTVSCVTLASKKFLPEPAEPLASRPVLDVDRVI